MCGCLVRNMKEREKGMRRERDENKTNPRRVGGKRKENMREEEETNGKKEGKRREGT